MPRSLLGVHPPPAGPHPRRLPLALSSAAGVPRSRSAAVLLVLGLAAGLVTGCSAKSETPEPAPAPAPAAVASTAAVSVDEPAGALACGKALRAVRDATLMNAGVVSDITAAANTADAPVADAAQHLSQTYTEAIAAHGTEAEPDAVAAVSAAAAELVKICDDSGLATAG